MAHLNHMSWLCQHHAWWSTQLYLAADAVAGSMYQVPRPCLHNVHHLVQGWDSHVSPAEVVHPNACCHEGLWVIAKARGWQHTPATVSVLPNLLQLVLMFSAHGCLHTKA